MWKICFVLAAIAWKAEARSFVDGGCSIPTAQQLDAAVAGLLEKVPEEFKRFNDEEYEISTGMFVGPTYFSGLKYVKVLKPYQVYCDSSYRNNRTTMMSVDFTVGRPLTFTIPWRFCETHKGAIRTTLLYGRFTVVFEVEQRADGSGVLLRADEVHPLWLEPIMNRLDGMGGTASEVFTAIGMLFPQAGQFFWTDRLHYYVLKALLTAAEAQ